MSIEEDAVPVFGWWFVFSAGVLCIATECFARVLVTYAARKTSSTVSHLRAQLHEVHVLAEAASTDDAAATKQFQAIADSSAQPGDDSDKKRLLQGADGGSPFFGLLSTIATKNVFLGVGLLLLLVPALVGQGVSIDFNGGTSPDSTSTTAP